MCVGLPRLTEQLSELSEFTTHSAGNNYCTNFRDSSFRLIILLFRANHVVCEVPSGRPQQRAPFELSEFPRNGQWPGVESFKRVHKTSLNDRVTTCRRPNHPPNHPLNHPLNPQQSVSQGLKQIADTRNREGTGRRPPNECRGVKRI